MPLINGGDLPTTWDLFSMIYAVFKSALQKNPKANAIVLSTGIVYSYEDADLKIRQIARYLSDSGVHSGDAS
jgi:acyl-CoA synthetase (AMP-forming)/AMP-acid ligase II